MRLIDADELIVFGIDDPENGMVFKFVPKDFIDDAPTIDAIPVVWITKQIGELIAQDRYLEAGHFAEIISLWRAENETY